MNISGISANATQTTDSSDKIAQLKKQLQNLQKQVLKEQQSDDDAKTKELKLEQLQTQIEAITAQIAQQEQQAAQNKDKSEKSSSSSAQNAQEKPFEGVTIDTRA
jgi:replication fork clamp-binding protein CrfC